jgi:hypothetical protein
MSSAIGPASPDVPRGTLIASARPDRHTQALIIAAALTCAVVLAHASVNARHRMGSSPAGTAQVSRGHLSTRLPSDLAPRVSADIGRFTRAFWPARRGASWRTAGGGLETTFTSSGALVRLPSGTVDLSAVALGRTNGQLVWLRANPPHAVANEVRYDYGSLTELYRNGPYGLEQGFDLGTRPREGTGALVIALRVSGSVQPQQVGGEVRFRSTTGATVLSDGALSAVDAAGRRLPAVMRLHSGAIELRINDSGARYPLRIDPFIAQAKIPGYGGTSFGGGHGSVALSADGNTALVGAWTGPGSESAWVFTRSGSTWSEQAQLKPSLFGQQEGYGLSVALSADGNTALVGGGSVGGRWGTPRVFLRSGSSWTEQAQLEGSGSGATMGSGFGDSVALSGDGNTALIGGPHEPPATQEGAAWVFTRSEGRWTRQGATMLRGTGEISAPGSASSQAEFGESVALSGDGQLALIGASGDNSSRGAAWVFERSGPGWIERGKLIGADEVGAGRFGDSVALAGDGHIALIGGSGAAWSFERSANQWVQQGSKLMASDDMVANSGHFGWSVALSADAGTALIGGPAVGTTGTGAAWLFRRSGSSWSQAQELTIAGETREGGFGSNVALSAEATTALISAPGEFTRLPAGGGAAWVFVGPPWSAAGGGPLPGSSTAAEPSVPPVLSGVSQSHRRWRAGRLLARFSRRVSAPPGTTFSFTLNEAATVGLVFTQAVRGRDVTGRCVAETKSNRHRRACKRSLIRGELRFGGRAGVNRISFQGRLTRLKRLRPGPYTLVIRARNAAGQRSNSSQLKFTIVS